MWLEIGTALRDEFSDLGSLEDVVHVVVRLSAAVFFGGLLGYERERRGTPAGLRTHMLVALGSALFVVVPLQGGMSEDAISRVLQGVIAGIGFLGAGAIIKLRDEHEIKGLTTAAGIWLTAAIGIAAGLGQQATAFVSTVFALVILAAVRHISPRHRE
jgi:putative Mg2+ transporter-C (MgtC) family protein